MNSRTLGLSALALALPLGASAAVPLSLGFQKTLQRSAVQRGALIQHAAAFAMASPITQYQLTLSDSLGSFSNTKFTGVAFQCEVISPRDPSTGLATGRRQHKPMVFTAEVGGNSPLLFQALVQNSQLPAVQFDMLGPDNRAVQTFKLTNAALAGYRQFVSDGSVGVKGHLYDELSFTFQKVEFTNLISRTTAIDDWSSNNS